MANDFLSLPTGLTEADYPSGSLLDYTPPDVRWQAPLAPTGENIWANYVMKSRSLREPTAESPNVLFGEPDLLRTYNRRLARYNIEAPGALNESKLFPGQPETMAEFGERHYEEFGKEEGRRIIETGGPFGGAALWSDPGRSPYLGYPGGVRSGAGGVTGAAGGRLPQPDVSGFEYAYPVWGWQTPTDVSPGYYAAEVPGGPSLTQRYYTQDIGQYPYFPYPIGAGQQAMVDGAPSPYITVGQEMLPTDQYPTGRFRYHAGNWWEA